VVSRGKLLNILDSLGVSDIAGLSKGLSVLAAWLVWKVGFVEGFADLRVAECAFGGGFEG
jgi:hypothetical protein